jgi:hypothetical protein
MAAPVDSFATPGLPPIWLKPVCCGVMRVGVRGALPLPEDVEAMPLYLSRAALAHIPISCVRGIFAQVLHEHVETLAAAVALENALQHGGHLAGLDGLQDLGYGLEMGFLWTDTESATRSCCGRVHWSWESSFARGGSVSQTNLGQIAPAVNRHLETAAECAFCVAASQQLAHLASQLAHLTLADLGERRVQRCGVEVDARILD